MANDAYIELYKMLIGKKVVQVAKGSEEVYALVFSDGTSARILQDAEGNGPGFLDIVPG